MFQNLSFRSYKISFGSWISKESNFKKTELKLELITDVDMLLIIEKGIRGGLCHAIHQDAKADNKYMEDMIKIKNHQILNIAM